MKKGLKIMGIVILALIAGVLILSFINSHRQVVEKDYQRKAQAGGELEAKYLQNGPYDVNYKEYPADEPIKKIEIYYPAELETSGKAWPVIVYCNGSGVKGSTIRYLLEHYASWGFIVLDSEDEGTWSGESADKTLSFLLSENDNSDSIFHKRVDTTNIGITGHSQGGVGVFNAITIQPNNNLYKTAVVISPTQEELAEALHWPYDLTKVRIPMLMLAGTGKADAETVIPLEKLQLMVEKLNAPKAMARKTGIDHDLSDSDMDGYVTAWMLWQLQNDDEAAKAFVGESAELLNNALYQDQRIDLQE